MYKKSLIYKSISLFLVMVLSLSFTSVYAATKNPNNFVDYDETAWYRVPIEYVVGNNWMIGNNKNELEPNREITRAEFATVVDRVFGTYKKADITSFIDTLSDTWYYDYMAMAVQMGFLEGISENQLYPNGLITREQAMTILARVLALPSTDKEIIKKFKDWQDISDWAVSSVASMIKEGRARGYLDGYMRPTQNITRAEFAQLLLNCIPNVTNTSISDKIFTDNVLLQKGDENDYTLNNSQFEDMLLLSTGMAESQVHIYNTDIARLVCWGSHDVYIYPGCRIGEIEVRRVDGPCIIHWMGDKDKLPFVNFSEDSDPDCDIVDKDGNPIPVIKDDDVPLDDKPSVHPGHVVRPIKYPSVYFYPQNGKATVTQRIDDKGFIVPIDEPKYEGYVFGGWYLEENCETKFSFKNKVEDGLKLYARWYTPAEYEQIEILNQMVKGSTVRIKADTDLLGLVGKNVLNVNVISDKINTTNVKIDLVMKNGEKLGSVEKLVPGESVDTISLLKDLEYGNYEVKWVVTPENSGGSFEIEAMLYVAYMW